MLLRTFFKLSLLSLSVSFALFAIAAPSGLDPSFGVGGVARSPVAKVSVDQGFALVQQPDGKIIVVGESLSDAGLVAFEPFNLMVMRLNQDGSLDTTFGNGGWTVMRQRQGARGTAVALQPDGRIVIGGYIFVDNVGTPPALRRGDLLVRLMPNGSMDTTFGDNGVVVNHIDPNQHSGITGIAIQPDGKIVAAGFTGISSPGTPASAAVTRFDPNGSLDTSFDTDGKRIININPSGNRINAVALQPDGKIILGGSLRETTGSINDFLMMRLNADGAFDTTFDGDGWLTTKIGTSTSAIVAFGIQTDGKIVVSGNSVSGAARDIALARYNTNGTLDASFDTDGVVITNISDEFATSMTIQADGKIAVAGFHAALPMPGHFIAIRYNGNDGSLDTTFNTTGYASTPFSDVAFDRANGIIVQGDGKLVLVGQSGEFAFGDVALVRHKVDGNLDNSFDGDGKVAVELKNGGDGIYHTALQPDGKIIAAGYAFGYPLGGEAVRKQALSRFNADGTVDTSFGDVGSLILPPPAQEAYLSSVLVQPDGKIVYSVAYYVGGPYTVGRLNSNGTNDESFGNAGVATLAVGESDVPSGLVLQADGKIVAAGSSFTSPSSGPSMVRFNTNGSPDAGFGNGGKVFTTDPNISGSVYALALQPDGKLVIAGTKPIVSQDQSFFTSRYNTNGTVDTSFGGTGAVYTSIGVYDSAADVDIQPDGKIVVAGYTDQTTSIVRYTSTGVLDNSFTGDGIATIASQGNMGFRSGDLAIQQNGKLVLAGELTDNVSYTSALARLKSDGSPDPLFGTNGVAVTPLGGYDSHYYSILLRPDGKIVAGGVSSNGSNDDFTLVQYLADATLPSHFPFDYDGDGRSDISVFRPSSGAWYLNQSTAGFYGIQFGFGTDKIVPADYDGDGKTDVAVYRPAEGQWYIVNSSNGVAEYRIFGLAEDLPAPADYDGDGKADICVFRPSTGTWYLQRSSNGSFFGIQFGSSGDRPTVGDFDGDGKADIGIWRPSNGDWYHIRSSDGSIFGERFGISTDKMVPADYDGDGKTDLAVWRPSSGIWYIKQSSDSTYVSFLFGLPTDIPAPGDFDGDGKADRSVFREADGTWYIANSTNGSFTILPWGQAGDRPTPGAFLN